VRLAPAPGAVVKAARPPASKPGQRLRRGPGTVRRRWESIRFLLTRDRDAVLSFVAAAHRSPPSLARRLALVRRCLRATHRLRGYHTLSEMLTVGAAILERAGRSDLTIVECGVGKGSSTAKLSHFVREAGGHLHAFDSFRGLPPNDERVVHLDGRVTEFRAGAFHGRFAEVGKNLARLGAADVVTLHKGGFADTLPAFDRPVDVALLDVDLVASTRSCLVHLYPRLRPGGVLFTQDGHLRGVVEVLADAAFWRNDVGVEPPVIEGLGARKLLAIEPRPPDQSRSRTFVDRISSPTWSRRK
jgi:O-methyltransferase